jgi:hypothetical protein
MLESNMLKSTKNNFAQQKGARPKDGEEDRQSPDDPKQKPSCSHPTYGAYSFQAHHAISGKEILENEPIEQLLLEGELVKKDTGYTVNTCANGVFLPAYPKGYPGWGDEKDFDKKLDIMKPAMDVIGQAHIGSHTGHLDPDLAYFHKDYVIMGKEALEDIYSRVMLWPADCFLCKDSNDNQKKPYVPPFKVNNYLDNLSEQIIKHLRSDPGEWEYFVSAYAMAYHRENCSHGEGHESELEAFLNS